MHRFKGEIYTLEIPEENLQDKLWIPNRHNLTKIPSCILCSKSGNISLIMIHLWVGFQWKIFYQSWNRLRKNPASRICNITCKFAEARQTKHLKSGKIQTNQINESSLGEGGDENIFEAQQYAIIVVQSKQQNQVTPSPIIYPQLYYHLWPYGRAYFGHNKKLY